MTENKYQVVCFGEVLWDILPSGAEPGGAPMNVAYHLHRQQKKPALITKIGDDAQGRELLDLFNSKGLSTEFFETDKHYETGKVYATQDDKGDMTYDIVKPVAWDYIQWQDTYSSLMQNATYFVYGSLAAREKQSRETLFRLLSVAPKKVFDINLRAPHYDKSLLLDLLNQADLLKMNEDELAYVSPWFTTHKKLEDQMKEISEKLNLSLFVVTKGGKGATLHMNDEIVSHPGFQVEVVDTVGSGDAFLSAVLSSLIDGAGAEATLKNASRLGSFVATKRGAMPAYEIAGLKEFYK